MHDTRKANEMLPDNNFCPRSVVPPVADGRQVGKGMWKAKEREPSVTKVPLSSILTILQGLLHAINQDQMLSGRYTGWWKLWVESFRFV